MTSWVFFSNYASYISRRSPTGRSQREKGTPRQEKPKEMIRQVIYASDEVSARWVLNEMLESKRKRYFTDKKSLYIIHFLNRSFEMLATHFRIPDSFRDNNITESVNDKIQMRLYLIRGYKKIKSARNSLKLIALHNRFNSFSLYKNKEHNGRSPLNLAGVTPRSLTGSHILRRNQSRSATYNVTVPQKLRLNSTSCWKRSALSQVSLSLTGNYFRRSLA
jgi:hypothetical protein